MACSRGKAHPNAATKLKLFTDSAGFCQNPACNTPLFPDGFDQYPHIAEMAHIFAASDDGPRANVRLTEAEKGAFENIILLCANCHTLVDKTPEHHSAKLMSTWKREHAMKRQRAFGVVKFDSREELRKAIRSLLSENAEVHRQIGPDNDYRFNPEASEATAWKQRVKQTIIPNSLRVLMLLDVNIDYLNPDEIKTLEQFRYHVQGLVMRHLEGQNLPNSRFPTKMDEIGSS